MALIPVQSISTVGNTATYTAAATSDTFANNGRTYIQYVNTNAATREATVDSLVNCNQGSDHNAVVTVPITGEVKIGPFPTSRYNDSGGLVTVTLDVITDVTVGVFSL